MSIFQELSSILDRDPAGLRAEQLLDEILWDTLNLLTESESEELARWAADNGGLAKRLLSGEEPTPAAWRLWYGGQLQGIAGISRALLGRRLALSTAAMLRRRHKIPILQALARADFKVSLLAEKVGLDESQILREIKDLSRHRLVETVKEGRERWLRITLLGRRALTEITASEEVPRTASREETIAESISGVQKVDTLSINEEEFVSIFQPYLPIDFAGASAAAQSAGLMS